MFELDELAEVFDGWRNRGVLTSANWKRLKRFYFFLEGTEEEGCTTCEMFKLQVKTKIYQYLKQNGIIIMAKERKWKFKNGGGSYQPFGSVKSYILEGEATDTTIILTDDQVDKMVEEMPSLLKSTFERNVLYVEPETVDKVAAASENSPKAKAAVTAKSTDTTPPAAATNTGPVTGGQPQD